MVLTALLCATQRHPNHELEEKLAYLLLSIIAVMQGLHCLWVTEVPTVYR